MTDEWRWIYILTPWLMNDDEGQTKHALIPHRYGNITAQAEHLYMNTTAIKHLMHE